MGLIDRAILQDEIRQALNALFVNGQVGRSNKVVLEWNNTMPNETMETSDERGTMAKCSDSAIDPATVKRVTLTARDANTGEILGEETANAEILTTEVCSAGGTLVVSTAGTVILWIVTAEDAAGAPNGDAIVGTWFCNTDSGDDNVSIAMRAETETIHPIDPKFLLPSRYLLNLSSVTIQQGDSVIHPSIYDFVALAAQNGGSFNTTIPAENCKELVAKATEWAKLSRGEDWNWLTSAPQLVVCDNIGILLMPTAIEHQHSTDQGLLQIFVGGTLRVKNGTTWITTHANCTIFFNEDGSIDMFVTATAV